MDDFDHKFEKQKCYATVRKKTISVFLPVSLTKQLLPKQERHTATLPKILNRGILGKVSERFSDLGKI